MLDSHRSECGTSMHWLTEEIVDVRVTWRASDSVSSRAKTAGERHQSAQLRGFLSTQQLPLVSCLEPAMMYLLSGSMYGQSPSRRHQLSARFKDFWGQALKKMGGRANATCQACEVLRSSGVKRVQVTRQAF